MKGRFGKILIVLSLFFCLLLVTNVNFNEIFSLPNGFITNYSEINDLNRDKKFGSIINSSIKENVKNTTTGEQEDIIIFKIFGLIPIRKVKVNLMTDEDLYIGGVPIGVSINSEGIIVNEDYDCLKKGDVLTEIDGKKIENLEGLEGHEVKYLRQNKEYKTIIKNVEDIKNVATQNIAGIGTLTYMNPKTNEFGALGHAITENKTIVGVKNGKIYPCNLLGIEKGKKNEPGQLKCIFLQTQGSKGEIKYNNKYGVFGKITDKSDIIDENLVAKIGGRLSVNPGKATIVSSISGIREEYDIEIIKASHQSKANDKSITFRVTDKRLLDLTGGIVQGMSGSPIMQNGKLIGAVTHVFTSDPTKGYGIYLDWMLLENK